MTKESKLVLRIGIILYIVLEGLSLLKAANIEALDSFLKITIIYLPITSIILFAYVLDRGEKKIAYMGLACLLVNSIIAILRTYGVVQYASITSEEILPKIVSLIKELASLGESLTVMLALFSLILNEKGDLLKTLAVISYVVYGLIQVLGAVMPSMARETWFLTSSTLFITATRVCEYSFIVFYLLNKRIDEVAEIKKENPLLQNTQVAPTQLPQQTVQPVQQVQQVVQQPVYQQPVQQVQQVVQQPVYQQPLQQVQQPVVQQPQQVATNNDYQQQNML